MLAGRWRFARTIHESVKVRVLEVVLLQGLGGEAGAIRKRLFCRFPFAQVLPDHCLAPARKEWLVPVRELAFQNRARLGLGRLVRPGPVVQMRSKNKIKMQRCTIVSKSHH